MPKINGSRLVFDEEDIRSTTNFLPRLIRIAFYRLQITNDSYIDSYEHIYKGRFPDDTHKQFTQKASADRKVLLEPKSITWAMLTSILAFMGWDIQSVQIEARDRLTGEVKIFSTKSTVNELNEELLAEKKIGMDSL